MFNSELFASVKEQCPNPELPDNGEVVEEFSMGSTLTLHDTDVVELLTEGIFIIIIGLNDEASKFSSKQEWSVDEFEIGPD